MKRHDDLRSAAICYGNAQPHDHHLAADIVAIDSDIVEWLEQRERRREAEQRPSVKQKAARYTAPGSCKQRPERRKLFEALDWLELLQSF